jgi:type VI secretion system secreted protein Hcp
MALKFYAYMKGKKTGVIEGDVTQKGREKSILCSAFDHYCESPRDVQSGLPTGKRRYHPIRIVKEVDKASPLLWQVLTTNETLTEVTFKFWRPSAHGAGGGAAETQFYTIKLTNANIAGMRMKQLDQNEMESAKIPIEEEVDFTFQKIEWEETVGKKMASDDWEAPVS